MDTTTKTSGLLTNFIPVKGFKAKKIITTSLAVFIIVIFCSICASATNAQIESLSVIDGTLYAELSGNDSRMYVSAYNEGVLVDVFFCDSVDGYVELNIGNCNEYRLFLWDKVTLAPVSHPYELVDGVAYSENSAQAVPPFQPKAYSFDQNDHVMVVSAISPVQITGYKAGAEVSYQLSENITVLGRADSLSGVVPGSVVLIGTNKNGECAAIELLASMGIPLSEETFRSCIGAYSPADGSSQYINVVTEVYSKSGSQIRTMHFPDTTKSVPIYFESSASMCYRIGISTNDDTPVITCTGKKISSYPSVFENTATYHNYIYLRYNNDTQRVKEAVCYCVPKDFDPGKGDDEYTDIFSAKMIKVIE